MSQCARRILDALSQDVPGGTESRLRPVKLSCTGVAAETDRSTAKVYFPFRGVSVDWIGRYALGR
jgi:hypothetical protein